MITHGRLTFVSLIIVGTRAYVRTTIYPNRADCRGDGIAYFKQGRILLQNSFTVYGEPNKLVSSSGITQNNIRRYALLFLFQTINHSFPNNFLT